jgi:hypothetical protein
MAATHPETVNNVSSLLIVNENPTKVRLRQRRISMAMARVSMELTGLE